MDNKTPDLKIEFLASEYTPQQIGSFIINRNFKGEKQPPYNNQGNRVFTIRLPEELSYELLKDGWNVNIKEERRQNPDDELYGFLQVAMRFDMFPPQIYQVVKKSNGKYSRIAINENTVKLLDTAVLKEVKMVIRPYHWEIPGGKSGVKAYLKTMYFELEPTEFESDYDWDDDDDDSDALPFEV